MLETPPIETARLALEPFSERHLSPLYLSWLNDPVVMRFSENRHRRHTLESSARYLEHMREQGHLFWAIEVKGPENLHIGNLSAYLDRPNEAADLSILVGNAECQGMGYGSEAWCAVVEFLLGRMNIRRVQAGTMSENRAMLALFRKSDMRLDGHQKERFLLDGHPVDLVSAHRLNPSR